MASYRRTPVDDTRRRCGFLPLGVGRCHAQTATDRFGPRANEVIRKRERAFAEGGPTLLNPFDAHEPILWPDPKVDIEDDPKTPESIYQVIPTPQSYRNSLTALSDIYNLYFVAYQNRVYVYRPRGGVRSTLLQDPDLQLRAEMSLEAQLVGGYLDNYNRVQGRSINHMITGFLGNEEILLHCCDNGDVVAYYTKDIANVVFKKTSTPKRSKLPLDKRGQPEPQRKSTKIQPFFSANVLQTAWGLAIHQKSRLIAVSSNRAEVTVFAFALAPADSPKKHREQDLKEPKDNVEQWVRQRRRNWTIVLELPKNADNVPNICFLESEEGWAEKVAAIDINGAAWVADIWTPHQPVILIPPCRDPDFISQEFYPDRSRGWGILGLRDAHFMEVDTVRELVGVGVRGFQIKDPTKRSFGGCEATSLRADLGESISNVPGNPYKPSDFANTRGAHHPHGVLNPFNPLMNNLDFIPHVDDFGSDFDTESEAEESDEEEMNEEEMGEGLDEATESETEEMNEEGNGEGSEDEDGEVVNNESSEASGTEFPPPQQLGSPPQNPHPPPQHLDSTPETSQDDQGDYWGDLLHDLDVGFHGPFTELLESLGQMNQAVDGLEQPAEHGHEIPEEYPTTRLQRQPRYPLWQSWDGAKPLLNMMYRPHNGTTEQSPMDDKSRREFADPYRLRVNTEKPKQKIWGTSRKLAPRYRLLRTYEKDFEMVRLPDEREKKTSREISVVCRNATCCGSVVDPHPQREFFKAASRLSMLAHIPELSVIILGSPTGRIILVTPTRLRKPEPHVVQDSHLGREWKWEWDRGMRIEHILPTGDDENRHRSGSEARPLYGLAVGRLPQVGNGFGEDGRGPVTLPGRYRIMLHYRNHLILSYEMTRSEETQKLCIF